MKKHKQVPVKVLLEVWRAFRLQYTQSLQDLLKSKNNLYTSDQIHVLKSLENELLRYEYYHEET